MVGGLLRLELEASQWKVVNQTELPVVCFVDRRPPEPESDAIIDAVARKIVSSGEAWISTTRLGEGLLVLRACITNYGTPYVIFEVIAALKVSNSLSVQQWSLRP